jgi:hypothetical protein
MQHTQRLSEELASKRHYADASQIAMEYLEDIESSVQYLAEGNLFSEAKRVVNQSHSSLECSLIGTLGCQTLALRSPCGDYRSRDS